jgi:hypothetical protein
LVKSPLTHLIISRLIFEVCRTLITAINNQEKINLSDCMPLTPGGIYIMRIQDEKKFSKIFKYIYIYIEMRVEHDNGL